jgi:hypothetical protein
VSKVVQCELRTAKPESDGSYKLLTTWLDYDRRLVPGCLITLKGIVDGSFRDIWWYVLSVGQLHERSDIKRGWGTTDYMGPVPGKVKT